MVIRQLEARLAAETRKRKERIDGAVAWLDLFAEPFPFQDWLQVKSVRTESANVAAVDPRLPIHGLQNRGPATPVHDPALVSTRPWLCSTGCPIHVEIGLSRKQVSLLAGRITGDQPAGEPL